MQEPSFNSINIKVSFFYGLIVFAQPATLAYLSKNLS